MKIIDISWPLSEGMTEYKNRNEVRIERVKEYVPDGVRSSLLTLGSHSGTHVDAPAHFMKDGLYIDQIDPERFQGKATVLDLSHVEEAITADDLAAQACPRDTIILLKTQNSRLAPNAPFHPHFIYLSESGAHFLAKQKTRLVGIDYVGIERNQPGHETHLILFHNHSLIVEGLRLAHVAAGEYYFVCAPLAYQKLDAAPARALLFTL